ncbi:hypothetical protein Tco_0155157 [Tanacetum coccineum]
MNAHADALSKLTALSFEHLSKDILVDIIKEKSILQPLKVSYAETDDTWMTPIFSYQYHDILSLDRVDSLRIWRKAIMYSIRDDILYRKTFRGQMARCIRPKETCTIIHDIYGRMCGMQLGYRAVAEKALLMGCYWPTVNQDVEAYLKTCPEC